MLRESTPELLLSYIWVNLRIFSGNLFFFNCGENAYEIYLIDKLIHKCTIQC